MVYVLGAKVLRAVLAQALLLECPSLREKCPDTELFLIRISILFHAGHG